MKELTVEPRQGFGLACAFAAGLSPTSKRIHKRGKSRKERVAEQRAGLSPASERTAGKNAERTGKEKNAGKNAERKNGRIIGPAVRP